MDAVWIGLGTVVLVVVLVAFYVTRRTTGSADLVETQLADSRARNSVAEAVATGGGDELMSQARALKEQGQAMNAIVLVREQTGLNLREAKQVVDSL